MIEQEITDIADRLELSRRPFLKLLFGFSVFSTLVGILAPIIGYLIPPADGNASGGGRVLIGSTQEIPVGQGKVLPLGNKPIIVINTNQGVKAFSAICTHLGCICIWDPDRQIILCPCHDGHFNPVTGVVMAGPPPAPLPPITVTVDGEDIYVEEA